MQKGSVRKLKGKPATVIVGKKDGVTTIQAKGEDPPVIPEGYEEVPRGEEKQGDLSYNVIGAQWEPMPDYILLMIEYLPLRYPAIRKKEGIE